MQLLKVTRAGEQQSFLQKPGFQTPFTTTDLMHDSNTEKQNKTKQLTETEK